MNVKLFTATLALLLGLAPLLGQSPLGHCGENDSGRNDSGRNNSTAATVSLTDFLLEDDSAGQVSLDDLDDVDDINAEESAGSGIQQAQFLTSPATAIFASPGLFGFSLTEPFGPIFRLDLRGGDGPGFDSNWVGASGFVPFHTEAGRRMWFMSLYGHAVAEGDFFASIEGGYRRYNPVNDRVFGWSAHLDADENFARIGADVQSVGRFMELRGGIDIAMGDAIELNRVTSNAFTQTGNQLLVNSTVTYQVPFSTIDGEIGGYLPFFGRYGWNGYVGAYAMWSDLADTQGAKARLQWAFADNILVDFSAQHDDFFGSTAWGGVTYSFPPGVPSQIARARTGRQRFADPVMRNRRIPRGVVDVQELTAATSVKDGTPLNIVYVDPDAAAVGDGTFETPYQTIEQARLANNAGIDIFYIEGRADGTSTNLQTNAPFQLLVCQKFLGGGVDQAIIANEGTFTIAAASPGFEPVIQNANGGDVLRLANQVMVRNVTLDGSPVPFMPMGNAIFGNGVSQVMIDGVTARNAVNGLQLLNPGGTVAAGTANQITNSFFTGNANDGMRVVANGGNVVELISTGNTATGNANVGFHYIVGAGSTINANDVTTGTSFSNNTATGNGTGAQFQALPGGTINVVASNNTLSNNISTGAAGLSFFANGPTSVVNVQGVNDNLIDGNIGIGVDFRAGMGGTVNVAQVGTGVAGGESVSGNVVTNSGLAGFRVRTDEATGTANVQIGESVNGGNLIDGNNFGVLVNNAGTTNVTVQANVIGLDGTGNVAAGVRLVNNTNVVGGGVLTALIGGPLVTDGNLFTDNGNGVTGLFNSTFTPADPTTLPPTPATGLASDPQVTVRNNTIDQSGNTGVNFVVNSAVTGDFLITENRITQTGTGQAAPATGSGVTVQGNNISASNFNITDNQILNSVNAAGVTTFALDNTTFTANIVRNVIANGAGDGFFLNSGNNAAETLNIFDNIVFNQTSNGVVGDGNGNGVLGNIAGAATPVWNIGGFGAGGRNTFDSNAGFGVVINNSSSGFTNINPITFGVDSVTGATVNLVNNLFLDNLQGGAQFTYDFGLVGGVGHVLNVTSNEFLMTQAATIGTATGIDLNIRGAQGIKFDPISGNAFLTQYNFTGNVIENFGVGFDTDVDASFHNQRFITFQNGPIVNNNDTTPLEGRNPEDDAGSFGDFLTDGVGGDLANYRENYLNTATALNAAINVNGNQIRNTAAGNAFDIIVSTNSYVELDYSGNLTTGTAAGNFDFVTASDLAGYDTGGVIQTANSIDNAGPTTIDTLFLDDTAQLSLNFTNNTGTGFISVTAAGATFTNADPEKNFDGAGPFNPNSRNAFLFHVANADTLNATNSFVSTTGFAQNLNGAFNGGRYHADGYEYLAFRFGSRSVDPFEDDFSNQVFVFGGALRLPGQYLIDYDSFNLDLGNDNIPD